MAEAHVDIEQLRAEIQEKYAEVVAKPNSDFHFHTGRVAAERAGYDAAWLDGVPESALGSFAGVANPFHWGLPRPGDHVVDVGSGAGSDSLIAANAVGPEGSVVGVDMTAEMLERSRASAAEAQITNVEFREGFAEGLPVEDGWADMVISNGVINLVPDKLAAYREIVRVLKPGGRVHIADICVEMEVPESAQRDVDLWTG
ncbi:MAG: methyltransferase domain-containing protein [Actinomycetota bacterium]